MAGKTIHLGYEVGTGNAVAIPLKHMVVTGQTQEAGKTTTLEALIARAAVPAVAFITKRGERSFAGARRIPPYFRERADWQFVASVLEAAMREKLKFERAWIMRASKGAATLADVRRNVQTQLATAKGLSADVYLTLDHYLEIVVPRIAMVQFAKTLDLAPGLNVLDLADRDRFPPELQSLVMRSALEWIYERAEDTIALIPEAWEFLPQGRGSPVKLAAVELIRKGAGLKNYVWLDSQDIGGIEKEVLRSCPVWLLGVQRETNEIKRVLENIPAPTAKPKPSDVARLKKGEFYACFGDTVVKTYVQPAWMSESEAINIAVGAKRIEHATPAPTPPKQDEEPMSTAVESKLDKLIDLMHGFVERNLASAGVAAPPLGPPLSGPASPPPATGPTDEEALYQRFKARLSKEAPSLLKLLVNVSEIEIKEQRQTVDTDLTQLRGMMAYLIADGFFDNVTGAYAAWKEAKRRWNYGGSNPRSNEQLDWLTAAGFLTKEADGYRVVAEAKARIRKV